MKTEKAEFPGMCYICGTPIYTEDVIVRYHIGKINIQTGTGTPVAAHAKCHPDFKLGGMSE